jgi:hypothetical protein
MQLPVKFLPEILSRVWHRVSQIELLHLLELLKLAAAIRAALKVGGDETP